MLLTLRDLRIEFPEDKENHFDMILNVCDWTKISDHKGETSQKVIYNINSKMENDKVPFLRKLLEKKLNHNHFTVIQNQNLALTEIKVHAGIHTHKWVCMAPTSQGPRTEHAALRQAVHWGLGQCHSPDSPDELTS